MGEVIRYDSPEFMALAKSVMKSLEQLDRISECMNKVICNDRYLNGDEVRSLLYISDRTLQNYRDNRIIP